MHRPYVLPRLPDAIAVATLRHHTQVPPLKITDPATRAMTDFKHEPALTITEDRALQEALDEMFRFGVRAFLVARERVVVGLITTEHARTARPLGAAEPAAVAQPLAAAAPVRVADVMTPTAEVPAVDWQVIEDAQVRDLVEIFEGSGAQYLVVLENETPGTASVRGLIHRERLQRQLGLRWCAAPPVEND